MSLLVVCAVGLLSLATIELRKFSRQEPQAIARANARLALMQAIGQLQRTLGPDQRVSASAEILRKEVKQPHLTGVWRTTLENGGSLLTRDDLDGGLRDARWEQKLDPAGQVVEWLASGKADPTAEPAAGDIRFYQKNQATTVSASPVAISGNAGKTTGHLAWWTGDLGVRANLQTRDPRGEIAADRAKLDDGGLYRVMASQAADMKSMTDGVDLENKARDRVASSGTIALTGVKDDWLEKHRFDFTTESSGVLADVVNGGLKQDLTAYFQNGAPAPVANLPSLSDDESLVGTDTAGEKSRHATAGPRFGLLRDWAKQAVPFSGRNVEARLPDIDNKANKATSRTLALANETPVKLAGNMKSGLQPILVEASNFAQWCCYLDRVADKSYFQLRQLMYPRVVLWNPYNCELKFGRSIIMIQGNGRQEMRTMNQNVNRLREGPYQGQFQPKTEWISFEGGRSTSFGYWGFSFQSEGYNDPYMGSYFFSIPATTFQPGECLVFSPPNAAEYDGLSAYRPGPYNLDNNVLSCEHAPDTANCYYVSASELEGGIDFLPVEFWYEPSGSRFMTGRSGIENQADDSRAILKQVVSNSPITFEAFDALPQVSVLSASLQYGAGREPRVAWSTYNKMPMQLVDKIAPKPTIIPDVRTREGIRLRWFEEHDSNTGSGFLNGAPSHFEDALLANWNPRASYIMRSPWENIGGEAPWFFGAYTRDLYDQAVSWDDQMPVFRNGRYHGNPFGPPQEGSGKYILFDVPRTETGLVSLGQLQHAKLSELIWHPSYAVGNSLADPRLGTGGFLGLHRTAARSSNPSSAKSGGFHKDEIGWASDLQRSKNTDEWAANARAILGEVPTKDNLVYDLSFEVNRKLWDRFYLSSGTTAEKEKFLADPFDNPLPNGRMRLAPSASREATAEKLTNFHQAARHLMVDGAFNVNSTRVEAWKALLGSTRKSGFGSEGKVPFPRVLDPADGAWKNGDAAFSDAVWSGFRELDSDEIHRLAEAIVVEVKARGPFLSLADFVNRRLAENQTGRMGALQSAIENAGLNSGLVGAYPLSNTGSLPDYKHPENIPDATRMEQTLKPDSKTWGAPAYLTQADVLQVIGPVLSARSDSFVIRAYGDAVDGGGKIQARAYCEAVIQRTPKPMAPDASGLNSRHNGQTNDFGREFIITSFRWLAPDEA